MTNRLLRISILLIASLMLSAGAGSQKGANDPIESDSAWGPRDQLKIIRDQRRQVRRTSNSDRGERELLKTEREISSLKQQQAADAREISRIKRQLRALRENR